MALTAPAFLSLGGLANAAPCEQRAPTVFVIKGETNQALADCIASTLEPTTTEVVVDSHGGPAGVAIEIAERLAALPDLTLNVTGQCASSCANYFLPLARRLVVGPRALIMVHGGIDPAQVASASAEQAPALQAIAEKQRAFAVRHGVPPGWLLYRTAEAPRRVDGLDGAYRWPNAPRFKLYLVEAPMLRSCLPWLDIGNYQARLEAERLTPTEIARLKRNGVIATGSIVCNTAAW
ncbi:MAG: hypothetical protein K6T71_06700 [Candidatus Bipolaricaulota bacterium]|nr:hypothetical protein [Candidatus Bipolaricaulota bacterium]